MKDDVVEKFMDVLQSIEASILEIYDDDADLLDLEVIDALDALIRKYVAEEGNRTPPRGVVSGRAKEVLEAVERTCEWRMGRGPVHESGPQASTPPEELHGIADILTCLKRIRKSVHLWNREGGRQGYLTYVSQFVLWRQA
jgi:hypothetical protein